VPVILQIALSWLILELANVADDRLFPSSSPGRIGWAIAASYALACAWFLLGLRALALALEILTR
jgi:hypothetical protein